MRSAAHLPGPTVLLYNAFNTHWEPHVVELPDLPGRLAWHRAVDTALPPGSDSHPPGAEVLLDNQDRYPLAPRSSVVLLARAPDSAGSAGTEPDTDPREAT